MNKKLFYSLLFILMAVTFTSCDDVETYAEQRDAEYSAISNYIAKHHIKVISEKEFLANDTTTDVDKNEYVLFDATGVYMQIERKGSGEKLKKDESATVLVRFTETNINGDSVQLTNNILQYHYLVDKFDVRNVSGSFYASFDTGNSLMYKAYGSASVPSGWLVPLSYINLGRLADSEDEIAKVRIIVPHDQGHSNASQRVYACHYDLTYQRGAN